MDSRPPLDCVERFSQCAHACPDACAVVDGARRFSYGQLYRSSRALAHRLTSAGVGVGCHVGVHADRSLESVTALWAILMAGAVYVPLNPAHPTSRLMTCEKAADLRMVLYSGSDLPGYHCPTMRLSDCPQPETLPEAMPGPGGDLAAYLIFTSGTSGEPKPVMVGRTNLAHHCSSVGRLLGLGPQTVALHLCSISFDISVEEVVPTLCHGGTLVVGSTASSTDPAVLHDQIERGAVSLINLPTQLWQGWMDWMNASGSPIPPALQTVVIGGEACPPDRFRQWMALAPRIRCINGYGPTETTITTVAWEFLEGQRETIPIGREIDHVSSVITDSSGNSDGWGELCIGGPLVSLGYYRNPRLTALRFVPDPQAHGMRLYTTGDRVRRNTDGDLEISGRLDRQIKLRGHRMEPAEIEHALQRHPDIRFAHVCVQSECLMAYLQGRELQPGGNQAFLTPAQSSRAKALVEFLQQSLPPSMIPTRFTFLQELPLTVNGKVDTSSLPTWTGSDLSKQSSPSARDQHPVLTVLAEVLGGLPDDLACGFAQAGGDSVRAMQASIRLRECGYDISPEILLGDTQIADLLAVSHAPAAENANATTECPMTGSLDCTGPQIAMLYHSLLDASGGYYIEQVEGVLKEVSVEAFQRAWDTVIERHAALRLGFEIPVTGVPRQNVSARASIRIAVEDLRNAESHDVDLAVQQALREDRAKPFDLAQPPLMRLRLLRLNADQWHFIWSYHHAILDGWSDLMILDEVFTLHTASRRGTTASLAEPGDYRRFAQWYASQGMVDHHLAVWKRHFQGHMTRNVLPVPGRGATTESRVENLDQRTTSRISQRLRRCGVTLNCLCTALAALAIAEKTHDREATVGTVKALRPAELDRIAQTAGPLIALLPERVLIPPDENRIDDWLQDTLRRQLNLTAVHHVPYQEIARTVASSEDSPLFDVVVVLENVPQPRNSCVAELRSHTRNTYPLNIIVWPGECLKIEFRMEIDGPDAEQFVRAVSDNFIAALECVADSVVIADLYESAADTTEDFLEMEF